MALTAAFWNTQQLVGHCGWQKVESSEGEAVTAAVATRRKLAWLSDQLSAERPLVLFLMEVAGTRKDFSSLRRWLKGRQYSSQILCGGGGKNGIVVAVDTTQGKLRSSRRVAAPSKRSV